MMLRDASLSIANSVQTLLIDADDTLWENNIYFERAIAGFISFLNHHEYSPEQVRGVLNEVERELHHHARIWPVQFRPRLGWDIREAGGRAAHTRPARDGKRV